ncbi:MAG: carboxymuconolactone decarboxylase family protein [Saprospirales bacterium]|nr:MAG: carboxymuconolactone decarboxylase family protein [Saprospirales bacterium]
MGKKSAEFNQYRSKMNDRILGHPNKTLKRFFSLDGAAYEQGALPVKTKEMLGLVASLVLRCDDCVSYHIEKCAENGMTEEEFFEILAIGNLVGGSICIPHSRRAVDYWDDLKQD